MGAPVSTNSYLRPTRILLGSTSEIYVVERARIDARVPRKFHWSMTRTKHRYVDRKLIDCSWKGRGCYFYSKKYRHTVCVQWISVNTYKSVALLIRAFNSLTHAWRSTHSNVEHNSTLNEHFRAWYFTCLPCPYPLTDFFLLCAARL